MAPDELISVAPPGASERRAVRFRGNLPAAAIAAIASIAVTVFTFAMLWKFDQSLHVDGARIAIARVIEVALALATLSVPFYGIRALVTSQRAERLAARDEYQDARIAVEDSRDHIWVVVGLGLTAAVGGFVAFLLSANHGAVRGRAVRLVDHLEEPYGPAQRASGSTSSCSWSSEVLVLVWALLVAVVRSLPGRACAPIRFLAIVYTDVFRGVPAVISIYLIVFGFALAGVPVVRQHEPERPGLLAGDPRPRARLRRVRRRGVPRRAREHPLEPDRGRPLARTVAVADACVTSSSRRPSAASSRRCSTTSSRCRRTPRSSAFVGALDILNIATIYKSQYFNLSPVTGAAIAFLIITIPVTRFVDYLIRIDKERTQARMSAFIELRDVHKSFGDNEVLRGVNLSVDEHQVVCLIGPSGCGKSTLLRCINALEPIDGGEIRHRRRTRVGPRRRRERAARRRRHRVPELQPLSRT